MAEPQNETTLVRLQYDVYKQLEKALPAPVITSGTTEHQVAFALGVQYVLKVLREGFVITP